MKIRGCTLCETITGEAYQPVRIYYRVRKRGAMQGRLKRLKCISPNQNNSRWNWFYVAEAREIAYDIPYSEIPKHYRPVPLGYFEWRSPVELHLNVFSLGGALKALNFFNDKFNRHLALPDRIRVVNLCFDESESLTPSKPHPSFDEFFERDDVYIPQPEKFKERVAQISAEYEDMEERSEALDQFMREDSQHPSPEVEEMGINIEDKEWASILSIGLMMKQIEAIEHWKGNTSFTPQDAIQELISMTDDF